MASGVFAKCLSHDGRATGTTALLRSPSNVGIIAGARRRHHDVAHMKSFFNRKVWDAAQRAGTRCRVSCFSAIRGGKAAVRRSSEVEAQMPEVAVA